jgi:8-oxo-dGTP pyrophosphatase MutT (NUDIX family)
LLDSAQLLKYWGIEKICPFLDRDVHELAIALADELKIQGLTTKWILRPATGGLVPDAITARTDKVGFAFPHFAPTFASSAKVWADELQRRTGHAIQNDPSRGRYDRSDIVAASEHLVRINFDPWYGSGAGAKRGTSVMLLIVTEDNRLLLHHRDDKPGILHPGCWAGFGGAVEEGESIDEALRREVLEEIGLELRDAEFLAEEFDLEGGGDRIALFFARAGISPEQIQLQEGKGIGIHTFDEVERLHVTPFVRRAIVSHLRPLIEA